MNENKLFSSEKNISAEKSKKREAVESFDGKKVNTEDSQERRRQLTVDSEKDKQESEQKAQEILKRINEGEGEKHTEGKEQGELKENDLIIPEGDDINKAQQLLEKKGIPFEIREYAKRGKVDEKGGHVPGEFILSVLNPQEKEEPTSSEVIIAVFEFLKENGVIVRYGKKPL